MSKLHTALAAMQASGLVAIKSRQVNAGRMQFEFANFADVWDVCRPHFKQHGIAVTQALGPVVAVNTRLFVAIKTVVTHVESGEAITDDAMVPIPDNTGANFAQAWGSAITYGKRYAFCALLGVITGDDDDARRAQDSFGVREQQAAERAGIGADPHAWKAFAEERWKAVPIPGDISGRLLGDCSPDELEKLFQRHPHNAPVIAASVWRCEQGLAKLKTTYAKAIDGREGWPASMSEFTATDAGQFLIILRTLHALRSKQEKKKAEEPAAATQSAIPGEDDPILFDDAPPSE